MSKELAIIQNTNLTPEEENALEHSINSMIARHKGNRQEINRLVFTCTEAMTEAEDTQIKLSNKGFLQNIIGELSGSNKKLQDKLNSNYATMQYASQQMMQKLAEQNLLSFELITAVNNKLNVSLEAMEDEFANIYQGLAKFLRHSRNEKVRLEQRVSKLEKKVDVLEWLNTIEYQEYNGEEYQDLEVPQKLVCLTHDFYQLTQGNWSTKNLLMLKNAMNTIGLDPKAEVNYLDVVEEIANDDELLKHLLSGGKFNEAPNPQYLLTFSALYKSHALSNEEAYLVNTAAEMMGMNDAKDKIRRQMLKKYMEQKADANIDQNIECFELVIDMLYSLEQAKGENILILPAGQSSAGQSERFSQAEQLYMSYHLEEAFPLFEESANTGNGRAMYFLGKYYQNALPPVKKADKEKAEELWNKGKYADDILANAEATEKLSEHDLEVLLQAAESGDTFAAVEYYYHLSNTSEKDFELLDSAAKQGNWEAMLALVKIYGTSPDGKGREWSAELCKLGCACGNLELGINLLHEEKYNDALSCLRDGYNLKDRNTGEIADWIGLIYSLQDKNKEAVKWYKKSAQENYPGGYTSLGNCYHYGIGVEEDEDTAIQNYLKAYKLAPNESGDAASELGDIFFYRKNKPQQAFSWYEKGADSGNAKAMTGLGLCYREGVGTIQDSEKAVFWFKQAAGAENADALYYLGQCYEYGNGIDEDFNAAYQCYEKAAEGGVAKAYNRLGILYSNGKGVTKNPKKAFSLFGKAAELGFSWGKYNLAQCYENGDGTKQDFAKARKWYAEAANDGIEDAKEKLKQCVISNILKRFYR